MQCCPPIAAEVQASGSTPRRRFSNHYCNPYAMPTERSRKTSTSSSSSCSDYSQPSPSHSVASNESMSPEPVICNECISPGYTLQSPAHRSPEREVQVFERLRQLVPILPSDRYAYQVIIHKFISCHVIYFTYLFNFESNSSKAGE